MSIFDSWEILGLRLWLQLRALKKPKLRLQLRDLIKTSASLRLRNFGLRTMSASLNFRCKKIYLL